MPKKTLLLKVYCASYPGCMTGLLLKAPFNKLCHPKITCKWVLAASSPSVIHLWPHYPVTTIFLMLSGTGHIRGFQWPLGWQEAVWPPAAVPSFHSQTEAFISLPKRRPSLGPTIMVISYAQGLLQATRDFKDAYTDPSLAPEPGSL